MPHLLDLDDARRRLERDRPWSAFALADLDPPYAQHATWFGPPKSDSVVLVYGAFDPPIVFCQGEPAECEAILAEAQVVSRTASAYINVTDLLWPIVGPNFATFEPRRMSRMLLHADLPEASSHTPAVALGPGDLGALQNLYAEEPPAFFLPEQVKDGVYFGVRQSGDLVAVAGTHVVSARGSVGAIGNVYTRPDCRGRGLAAEVTGAVARELRRRGIATIGLNVADWNGQARRVYQRQFVGTQCFGTGVIKRIRQPWRSTRQQIRESAQPHAPMVVRKPPEKVRLPFQSTQQRPQSIRVTVAVDIADTIASGQRVCV